MARNWVFAVGISPQAKIVSNFGNFNFTKDFCSKPHFKLHNDPHPLCLQLSLQVNIDECLRDKKKLLTVIIQSSFIEAAL